jgi:hypothetical protein
MFVITELHFIMVFFSVQLDFELTRKLRRKHERECVTHRMIQEGRMGKYRIKKTLLFE